MSQALYRKWRSQTFEEVIGQEHVTQTLRNALRDGRVAHAYLFSGPRGTGKTSTARILAKAINCSAGEEPGEEPGDVGDETAHADLRPCNVCANCMAITEGRMIDLVEIDAASNNSVDDVRELRDKVGFRPADGRYKIYIIDEVHMLSNSAFNALLKTLEEPPPHARFVLATTEPHKIPATVISRCQRFDFRRIPVPEIAAHLQHIVDVEGFKAESTALSEIGRNAQGCMRDAVSLLDQMFSYGTDTVTLEQVQQVLGTANAQAVSDLVDALAKQDVATGITLIQQLLTQGASLIEYCHQVVEYLRGVLVLQMTNEPSLLDAHAEETVQQMAGQAKNLDQARTLFAIKRFSEAVPELKGGFHPQLPLEMALIESIRGPETAPAMAAVATAAIAGAPVPAKTAPAAPATNAKAAPAAIKPTKAERQDAAGATNISVPDDAGEAPPLDHAAIEKLRGAGWKNFLSTMRDRCGHRIQGCLVAVRDVAIAESTVVFAFGNNTFSHDTINENEAKNQVVAVLSEILERPVVLQCQMGQQAELIGMQKVVQSTGDSGPDPLVEYAVSSLGAKVVE